MRLSDLQPRMWGRRGGQVLGYTFRCPHCPESGVRLAVAVHPDGTNTDPEPGNPQQFGAGDQVWTVDRGTSFADLTLSPSIDASGSGHWHGFITDGEMVAT